MAQNYYNFSRFFLVFLAILSSSIASVFTAMGNLSLKNIGMSAGISFIVALLLILLYSPQKDNFTFNVSEPKLCKGGEYMYTSAPKEVQDYCNQLLSTPEGRELNYRMNCSGGFHNRSIF